MDKKGVALLSVLLFLPFRFLQAQEETFSNIYTGLDELESLMSGMQERNELLRRNTESLTQNLEEREAILSEKERALSESEASIGRLESLCQSLREQSEKMRRAYREQSKLLDRYARRSKALTCSLIIGIPSAAALAAGITLIMTR